MSHPASQPRARLIAAVFLATTLCLSFASAAQPADVCAPPASLRVALQERFGSSRVLTLGDLYPDERVRFQTEHKGACPGLTTGQFFTAEERLATAVVILGVGEAKDIRLVVARPALSAWILTELDRMDRGGTAVVSTGRSGTAADDSDGIAAGKGRDVVLLTAIETWTRAYVWSGRLFEKHQTNH